MKLLAVTPLGRNRVTSRLWIETCRLEALVFPPGTPFSVETRAEELLLKPAILAENHVSSRAVSGGRRPIINLANQAYLEGLADFPELKITGWFESYLWSHFLNRWYSTKTPLAGHLKPPNCQRKCQRKSSGSRIPAGSDTTPTPRGQGTLTVLFVPRVCIYTMKERFWLFKRGNVYYFQDSATGNQLSLGTKSHSEAQRLLEIRRQTSESPSFNLLILKTCLTTQDAEFATRKWSDVMTQLTSNGKDTTKARCQRAVDCVDFNALIETRSIGCRYGQSSACA